MPEFRVGNHRSAPTGKVKPDICRLGEPELFWGISGGLHGFDWSPITRRRRKKRLGDDLTAGGRNNRRPDRAVVVYSNLIRQYYKNTKPLCWAE